MLRSPDTTAEAHAVQIAVYRRMTGSERMLIGMRLSDGVRAIARDGIRGRHPEYTEAELDDALRRLVLGDALFVAAWPGHALLPP